MLVADPEKEPYHKVVTWSNSLENGVTRQRILVNGSQPEIRFTPNEIFFGCYKIPVGILRALLDEHSKEYSERPSSVIYQHRK